MTEPPIRPQLRKQLWEDPDKGEQARDIQQAFDRQPRTALRTVVMQYSEPLVIGNLREQPAGIEAIRILEDKDQQSPVRAGGLCHFAWLPQKGGAVVGSIDGMNVPLNGGKSYRFTFRFTYEPAQG